MRRTIDVRELLLAPVAIPILVSDRQDAFYESGYWFPHPDHNPRVEKRIGKSKLETKLVDPDGVRDEDAGDVHE